jgi:hypothetical protein
MEKEKHTQQAKIDFNEAEDEEFYWLFTGVTEEDFEKTLRKHKANQKYKQEKYHRNLVSKNAYWYGTFPACQAFQCYRQGYQSPEARSVQKE